MDQRTDARHEIEAARSRMTEIADELSRRASSGYIGGKAKEVAMERTREARTNPKKLGMLGALAGGGLGFLAAKMAKKREAKKFRSYGRYEQIRPERSYVSREFVTSPYYGQREAYDRQREAAYRPDYEAAPEVSTLGVESWRSPEASRDWSSSTEERPGAKEKMQEAGEKVSAKAHDVGEKVSSKASELREKAGEKFGHLKERAGEMKDKAGHGGSERLEHAKERAHSMREHIPSRDEIKHQAEEHPFSAILGGMLIGAAAAALLPLSRREKKAFHSTTERAKEKVGSSLRHFEEQIESRLGGDGASHPSESASSEGRQSSPEPSAESIHEREWPAGPVQAESGSEEAERAYRQPDFEEVTSGIPSSSDDTVH